MPEPDFLDRPDGHRIAYQQVSRQSSNANPANVIFLGGFKSDMTGSKALFLEAWCRQQSLGFVRFDYLGHGASSGRFQEGTIGRWRDDALAILDDLTQGPQILVGSSMGGWISLLVARSRPERIAGIVTIAAATDFTETLIWQRLPPAEQEQIRRDGVWQRPSEYSSEPYPITYRLIEEGRQHMLLQKEIPIRCPVRLLHGMQDADVPWQTSTAIAQRLASENVRVELIKDGEHRLSRPSDLTRLQYMLAELLMRPKKEAPVNDRSHTR